MKLSAKNSERMNRLLGLTEDDLKKSAKQNMTAQGTSKQLDPAYVAASIADEHDRSENKYRQIAERVVADHAAEDVKSARLNQIAQDISLHHDLSENTHAEGRLARANAYATTLMQGLQNGTLADWERKSIAENLRREVSTRPDWAKKLGQAGVDFDYDGIDQNTRDLYEALYRMAYGNRVENALLGIGTSIKGDLAAIPQSIMQDVSDAIAYRKEFDGDYWTTPTREYQAAREAAGYGNRPLEDDTYAMRMRNIGQMYKNTATGGLSNDGLWDIKYFSPKWLAEQGISIAENAPNLAISAVNPALGMGYMIANAGGARALELAEQGVGVQDAAVRGLTSGAIEAVTEKFSIDNWMNALTNNKGILMNILGQMGVEASEESASYVLNYIADMAAKDPNAKFSVDELIDSAVGGAFSGGIYGTGGQFARSLGEYSRKNYAQAKAQDAGRTADFDRQYDHYNKLGESGIEFDQIPDVVSATPIDDVVKQGAYFAGKNDGVKKATVLADKALAGETLTDAEIDSVLGHKETRQRFENAAGVKFSQSNVKNRTVIRGYAAKQFAKNAPTVYGDKSGLVESEISKQMKAEDVEFIDTLLKATGSKGMIMSELSDSTNAYVENGLVAVYANAGDAAAAYRGTFKHEITHRIKELGAETYGKYESFAVAAAAQRAGMTEAELIRECQERYSVGVGQKLTESMAREEIAADFAMTFDLDTKTVQAFVNQSRENRKTAKGILETIRNVIRSIKKKFSGRKLTSEQQAFMNELNEAERLWAQALGEASQIAEGIENKKTVQTDGKKFSLKSYSEQQKKNWEHSKRIVVYNDENQLARFIQDSISDKTMSKKMYFGAIPSDLADEIKTETGLDVENFNLSLGSYEIRKILKDHGDEKKEALRGQRAIMPNDFKHIVDVVLKPQRIRLSETDYMGKPAIEFIGENNGRMNVVAVVSDKRLDLFVQTAYVNVKKRNLSTPTGEQAPINTPEASSGTVSFNILSRNEGFNNGNPAQNSGRKSIKATADLVEKYGGVPYGVTPRTVTPSDIANISEEDASTTPKLKPLSTENERGGNSKLYGSLQNSQFVDDQAKELFANEDDLRYYQNIGNKETLENANHKLNVGGARETLRWMSLDPHDAIATDVAEGFILMKRYQDAGDYESMLSVVKKLRQMGTRAGQTVQAFSILGRMTPEGMTAYAQMELNDARQYMIRHHGQAWADKHKAQFDLTKEEVAFITDHIERAAMLPDGRDKNIILAEIASMLQAKLPSSFGEKLKGLARVSMLLNPKTMVRNVLGNVVMTPVNLVADVTGTAIDKALSVKSGVRTTGLPQVGASLKAAKRGLYESFDDFRRDVDTRAVTGDRFQLGGPKPFRNYGLSSNPLKTISSVIAALDRVMGFLLDAGDRPFFEAHFISSLNNQMKRNGVNEPTEAMIDIATNEAMQRTWQDDNGYTKFVSSLAKGLNFGNDYGFGSMMIPFTKTPANLTKALVEYSPVGLIQTLGRDAGEYVNSVKNGEVDPRIQKKLVSGLSKAIAGTLAMVFFYVLADRGLITGDEPEDDDLAAFEKNIIGKASYSVVIDGKSYSYDWAQPAGGTAAIMADFQKSMETTGGWKDGLPSAAKAAATAILNALSAGGNVLFEQSFMQGVKEMFKDDGVVMGIINVMSDAPTQFVPTALSQIAQMCDPYVRTSYTYQNIPATTVNQVKAKIPVLREDLAIAVDVLGNDILAYDGANNAFNVFLMPANMYSDKSTAAAKEIYRVYEETGSVSVIPRVSPRYLEKKDAKYIFTNKERSEFQRTAGKTNAEIVEKLLRFSGYNELSDDEKASVLKVVTEYANDKAVTEYYEAHDIEHTREKWIVDGEKSDVPMERIIVARAMTTGLGSLKDKDGVTITNSYSLLRMQAIYSIAGLNDKQRQFLYEACDVGKSVRHYNKARVNEELSKMRKQAK